MIPLRLSYLLLMTFIFKSENITIFEYFEQLGHQIPLKSFRFNAKFILKSIVQNSAP